jgi:hypothetical protein
MIGFDFLIRPDSSTHSDGSRRRILSLMIMPRGRQTAEA